MKTAIESYLPREPEFGSGKRIQIDVMAVITSATLFVVIEFLRKF